MSQSKPTLHHMNNSQSQRILWLLEELEIDYTLVNHFRQPSLLAPPELKKIHPLGKSPLLVTADNVCISESIAIITYLLLKYDQGPSSKFGYNPKAIDSEEEILRAVKDEELVSFAGTTLGNTMMLQFMMEVITKKTPLLLRWLPGLVLMAVKKAVTQPSRKNQLACLEGELGDKKWFSGSGANPGRADFVLSFPFDILAQREYVDLGREYPKLAAWRERILSRAAWKSALTKGNGYDLKVF